MKVVRLGQGEWTVHAICLASGSCPVLDFVASLDPARGHRVLADLREYVPNSSPQHWVRGEFSTKLKGVEAIYEFRWPTKRGGTPRVLWFYDDKKVVVCSNGTDKKGTLRMEDIERAREARKNYLSAIDKGQLEIVDPEDMDCDGDHEA